MRDVAYELTRLRVSFDMPQRPVIELPADLARMVAADLIIVEHELDERAAALAEARETIAQLRRDLYQRERELTALRNQAGGSSATILEFRPRSRPAPIGGDAA